MSIFVSFYVPSLYLPQPPLVLTIVNRYTMHMEMFRSSWAFASRAWEREMKGWELSKKKVILQYIKKFNISIKKKSLTSAALVKRNQNGKYHSVTKVVLFVSFSFVALSQFEIPGPRRDKFTIKIKSCSSNHCLSIYSAANHLYMRQ